jgi:FAD/FMN-containing dehydrogenase/Fe-S oxidoreductase
LRELTRRLAQVGRRFAPDPVHLECTLGGMLATNASGGRAFKYGYTRDHVERLRIVLDNGDVAEAAWHARWSAAETPQGRLEDIVSSVIALLHENADLLTTDLPRTRFNRCGYLLHDVLRDDALNLARLLVGSEGTLAFFTEATLRTVPLPGGRALLMLGFESVDAALRAAQLAVPTGQAACDLMDRRLLTLARGNQAVAALIPALPEAVLLVEYEADTQKQATSAALALADRLHRWERLALWTRIAVEDDDIECFWQVREAALPSLYAIRGAAQPLAFVEDIAVPAESLAKFLHDVQEVLQKHETTASYFIHAATGQVHLRPFLDLHRREDVARLWPLADDLYTIVLAFGGTISTQHGTGLARTPWVSKQYFRLYPVFKKLKAIFDPRHLLNPGKIVGPAPGMPAWPLRNFETKPDLRTRNSERGTSNEEQAAFAFHWTPLEMAEESHSCNGCAQCRVETAPQRMCPIFRATHIEAATPRAKANLMRHLLHPEADPHLLSSEEVRDLADLCVNCKMCARECPAHVNIPKLMLEAKAAYVAQHGLDRSDWLLARTEQFARFGSAIAPLANELLDSPIVRWLLEKLFGVSRHRRLPAFAEHSFLRRARRRGWTRKPRTPRPRVAYFIDVYANYNDPLIAEAVVAVLHHNGIEVYVPPGQIGCGMAPLAAGDVETAREIVQHNLRVLAELAREGCPILCSEPTAALMLRHDALDLLDDPDVRLVAAQTVEFTAYLWDLHQQGQLRTDFLPLNFSVGHHVPCHLKALGRPAAGPALLSLIPQLQVHTIDVSCSGMAGNFGLNAANYAVSLEAGRPMLEELSRPRVLFGSTECSTCRLQMEDGSRKRTLHPAQYLALAYGFLPQLRQRLLQPIGPLVLR